MRPLIIAMEGLDGVGKTTLARRLAECLGAVYLTTPAAELRPYREPFDQQYQNCPEASQLFYAASVVSVGQHAVALRDAGQSVVIDRYWSSTRVYAREAGSQLILDEVARILPAVDVTLSLELEEHERVRRLRQRGLSVLDQSTLGERAARLRAGLAEEGPWSGEVVRFDMSAPTEVLIEQLNVCLSSLPICYPSLILP